MILILLILKTSLVWGFIVTWLIVEYQSYYTIHKKVSSHGVKNTLKYTGHRKPIRIAFNKYYGIV